MTTLSPDLIRPGDAQEATTRQAARHAAHAHDLVRDAVKRELEAEIRGLLMAARVHGFNVAISDGKPLVTPA